MPILKRVEKESKEVFNKTVKVTVRRIEIEYVTGGKSSPGTKASLKSEKFVCDILPSDHIQFYHYGGGVELYSGKGYVLDRIKGNGVFTPESDNTLRIPAANVLTYKFLAEEEIAVDIFDVITTPAHTRFLGIPLRGEKYKARPVLKFTQTGEIAKRDSPNSNLWAFSYKDFLDLSLAADEVRTKERIKKLTDAQKNINS